MDKENSVFEEFFRQQCFVIFWNMIQEMEADEYVKKLYSETLVIILIFAQLFKLESLAHILSLA